ncbi:fluoride efflux transporter CrcB [Halomarina pelagica]|uniref:fluoride efflux transporter CrcB n=1 Tax=Halomarina pelagica TaxID=2961599 RepID=UPI0020C3D4E8|nr:fluoride efflux transporter CrcB [Halomarina sp. BND7]
MVALDPAQLVGLGGVLGAVARHLVSEAVDVEWFPLGTLAVNVLGSFALGLLAFGGWGNDVVLLLGTGACGSFTTFSSFSFQTVRLWEAGDRARSAVNALGNLAGALVALGLAWLVAGAL